MNIDASLLSPLADELKEFHLHEKETTIDHNSHSEDSYISDSSEENNTTSSSVLIPLLLDTSPTSCWNYLYTKYTTDVAKLSSRKEREENGFISTTLVYGEIDYSPFVALLKRLQDEYTIFPNHGGMFLDIGCGSGKAVFAAALSHDFDLCMGIEVLFGTLHVCVNNRSHGLFRITYNE